MKKKRITVLILMLLPLAVVLISLIFLPEVVPAHYNIRNQVTRWGSKYETLIFPAITIIFGLAMLGISRLTAYLEGGETKDEAVCLILTIVCLLFFNAITFFFLCMDFQETGNSSAAVPDIYRIIFAVLGVCMIAAGIAMPKVKQNSRIGIRTCWSMKNEVTWKKSQLFGGASFIAGGIAILVICVFTQGAICMAFSLLAIAAIAAADVTYTYEAARKY